MKLTVNDARKIIAKQMKVRLADLPSIAVKEGFTMELTFDKLTIQHLEQFAPDLVKQIREGADKDQALTDLQARVDELETGNEKLLTEKQALEQMNKELEDENEQLKKDKDELEVAEALRKKKEQIDTLLKEADLPEEALSDTFRQQLERAKDEEEIKSLIEDRKGLASQVRSQVHNAGDEYVTESTKDKESGKAGKPTEGDIAQVREAFTTRRVVSEVADDE